MPIKDCMLIAEDSENNLKFNDSDYETSYVVSILFYISFIIKLQRATFYKVQ